MTVCLKLKKDFDVRYLDTGDLCLGYDVIKLLFNVGPFRDGNDCLLVEADGEVIMAASCDLIHDLEAYEMSVEK